MGLSQPSVSRIISGLEGELGAALFVRTTHAVTLTEAGAEYLARVEPILAALEEADLKVTGIGELRGRLRVGASTSFAIREIIPRLPAFLDQHPALRIDLVLTDSRQDLITESIDVVVRFGPLGDSALIARKLGESRRILVASPTYLERAGTPAIPADLVNHRVVVSPVGAASAAWVFRKDGKSSSVRVEGHIVITTNEGSTAAAAAGLGIVSTGHWACRSEIERGTLVQLLPDWDMGVFEAHAVLSGGRAAKPSARAFVDYVVGSLREDH